MDNIQSMLRIMLSWHFYGRRLKFWMQLVVSNDSISEGYGAMKQVDAPQIR
jgi:hypothetical protein